MTQREPFVEGNGAGGLPAPRLTREGGRRRLERLPTQNQGTAEGTMTGRTAPEHRANLLDSEEAEAFLRRLLRSYRDQQALLDLTAALGGQLELAAVIEKILATLTERL